eukprot:15363407-Ditylum_brightwellii.AAC.1
MKNEGQGKMEVVLMDPSSFVFPGSDQGDKFLKGFNALLVENEKERHQMRYDLEDIETHNICKGATTYTSSGTAASLGGIRINIRGGWIMDKVQNTYMLHPQLICLKSGDKDDAIFTSHQTVLDVTVHCTTVALFPSLSLAAGILFTLQVSLVSLCHNRWWLLDNVPGGTE